MEFFQLFVGQNGDDEQDGVRAPFDGFKNLAFINDEIFAQQGNFYGGADLPEIIERALEKLFVRQNGKAACARRLVFFRNFYRIKILANDSGGWRCFFEFRNQRDVAARIFQRGNKITPLAMLKHRVVQIADGDDARGQLCDFAFLFFNNFFENVHKFILPQRRGDAEEFINWKPLAANLFEVLGKYLLSNLNSILPTLLLYLKDTIQHASLLHLQIDRLKFYFSRSVLLSSRQLLQLLILKVFRHKTNLADEYLVNYKCGKFHS